MKGECCYLRETQREREKIMEIYERSVPKHILSIFLKLFIYKNSSIYSYHNMDYKHFSLFINLKIDNMKGIPFLHLDQI